MSKHTHTKKLKQPKPKSKKQPRKLPPGMLHSQNIKRTKVRP